ncbi:3-methyl-2-oxobutanoate hydroxymethyltransferase [Microlunatus panaciterrae]
MSYAAAAEGQGNDRARVTVPTLAEMKRTGEAIVMVTAYDHPSARIVEEAGVDVVLVGDSGAMTVLGYPSTVEVGLEEMLMMAKAVRRGLSRPLLVGDLPFGSYEVSNEQAVSTAIRFIKEAGCDAVKLEGGGPNSQRRAEAMINAGIPVMGHVGLTPQTAAARGGLRAQGRTAEAAERIGREAQALTAVGCFALIFEAIPAAVTAILMPMIEIPVIGIGAGGATDGQVLVFHDLLGLGEGPRARFVKQYADLHSPMVDGVGSFAREVRERGYPQHHHEYGIAPTELTALQQRLNGPDAADR